MRLIIAIVSLLLSAHSLAMGWQHSYQHRVEGGFQMSHQINNSAFPGTVRGNGIKALEERTIESFSKLRIQLPAEVVFQQQEQTSVHLSADKNLLSLIKTEVKDGTLEISSKKGFSTVNPIKITINGPLIEAAELQAGGMLSIESVDLQLLHLQLTSSGQIKLSGEVDRLLMDILGSGSIDSSQADTQDCRVRLQGAGMISAHCQRSAQAYLLGSGLVTISRKPEIRDVSGWGAGQVMFN